MPKCSLKVSLYPGETLRADRYITKEKILNRSQIKSRELTISIQGKTVKLSHQVKDGDQLDLVWNDPQSHDLIPEKIDLDILYENSQSLVINKPQGLVVHPAAGHWSGTMANALLYYLQNESPGEWDGSSGIRPGIVHRLDKDTSGVIVAAKTPEALEYLCGQFADKRVQKEYLALVKGRPPQSKGIIEGNIARDPHNRQKFTISEDRGKPSVTEYAIEESFRGYTLMRMSPKTGRTHQLRVHLKSLGTPILGDPIYSRSDSRFPHATLMLHAQNISIALPPEKERRSFSAPVPERFESMIKALRTESY